MWTKVKRETLFHELKANGIIFALTVCRFIDDPGRLCYDKVEMETVPKAGKKPAKHYFMGVRHESDYMAQQKEVKER